MITVEEAHRLLLSDVPDPEPVTVSLARAVGLVSADDVDSDIDLPPFDKSMMDGYAVIADDATELDVVEEIPAGRFPEREVLPGTCSKIMTGAPLPPGADAVQQVEKTERVGSRVRLLEPVKMGQNVALLGLDLRKGDRVVKRGTLLGPAEIGMLATVGRSDVRVFRRPTVALIVTGDEIVEPGAPLGPAQIRNSNAYSLQAQLAQAGFETRYLGIARDRRDEIREKIREGLREDLLVLSGGVSAGDWDFVIPCLEAEGVEHRMHQVLIKPGRPLFFGTLERKRIFGLPGNPVSTFVTFEVFVRPFLGKMMGADLRRRVEKARLTSPISKKSDRRQYLPGRLHGELVDPVPWTGSADLAALTRANTFIVVPVDTVYETGAVVDVMML